MNEFELHVIDDFAFFSNPTELGRSNEITVTHHGEEHVDLVINGKIHRMTDGTVTINMGDMVEGLNICQVLRNRVTIPCEGITLRGWCAMPAGITNKSLVLSMHSELKRLTEQCAELQAQLDKVAAEEVKEDLLAI